jgi:hypothetical protein
VCRSYFPQSRQTFGVPQGSVLALIVFTFYTTSLGDLILIPSTSVDHRLYADDTQLFISFKLNDFLSSYHVQALSDELSTVSTWMSSKLLAQYQEDIICNFSEMRPNYLSTLTISDLSLHLILHPSPLLGIIFDSQQTSLHSKRPVSIAIRDVRHIRNTLDHKSACAVATSLYSLNSTTATPSTSTYPPISSTSCSTFKIE